MVVDFHTHVFPDRMAEATVAHLKSVANITAYSDGTTAGLTSSMRASGVDVSVVLPVVTKPRQFHSVNLFAEEINRGSFDVGGRRLLSFGGIHPDSEDVEGEVEYLASRGFKGIKLHPDYQGTFINDNRYLKIVKEAAKYGLFISVHAGLDVGIPDPVHCPPLLSRVLLDESGYDRIILAHLGGFAMWDDVEKYLVGRSVYFDLGVVLGVVPDDQLRRIISGHGSDKILFATDSPWGGQRESLEHLKSLGLDKDAYENITHKNAERILGF